MRSISPSMLLSRFVLLSSRNFVLLWLGQTVSVLGDAVFNLTLILWIAAILGRQQAWAPLAVSGGMLAAALPIVLVGPLAGVFVDRWDKRRTMLWMDMLRALLVASLLLVTGNIPLPFLPVVTFPPLVQLGTAYVVVFFVSTCTQFFTPARLALTGDIVEEPRRAQASSLEQITQSLSMIVGPLLAAPLLFAFGVQWALLMNALSFILSWLAVAAIRAPSSARSVQAKQTGHLRKELWQGLRFSLGHQVIRALLVALFIAMLGAGAFNTLYVFFFLQNLHTPVTLLGLVDAIFGVGIIGGAVLAGIFAQRLGLERILTWAALIAGVAFVVLARMTNLAAALSMVALVGVCQGGLGVALWPLVLKVTPRELVGRVAALLNPSSTLAELLAAMLSGYLAGAVLRGWHAHLLSMAFGPIDTIFAGAGLFIILAGFYLLKNLRATAKEKRMPQFISHPRFAAFYTWLSNRPQMRRIEDPLRRETVGLARGIVLEVGAGGGQNFPFYDADRVVRLEASEPDEAMLAVARGRLARAPVPVTLTQAAAEALPFPDEHFDTVVATAVFCSVGNPERGLREIWRVLKPGGSLLLLEHVRAQGKPAARVQDALVPVTTRLFGNCHWNRDTKAAVLSTGFQVIQTRQVCGGLQPVLCLSAIRPTTKDV